MDKPTYNPNHLLDVLLNKMQWRNDAAMARALNVTPLDIVQIRRSRLPVGASLLIRMHEVTGISIRDLRNLMGDRRIKYRLSDAPAWTDAERAAVLGKVVAPASNGTASQEVRGE